jgi:hypothetical protein
MLLLHDKPRHAQLWLSSRRRSFVFRKQCNKRLLQDIGNTLNLLYRYNNSEGLCALILHFFRNTREGTSKTIFLPCFPSHPIRHHRRTQMSNLGILGSWRMRLYLTSNCYERCQHHFISSLSPIVEPPSEHHHSILSSIFSPAYTTGQRKKEEKDGLLG